MKTKASNEQRQPPVIQFAETFKPSDLYKNGDWRIWRGPVDGDGLEGEEEIYEPAGLTALNVGEMLFESFSTKNDSISASGEIALKHARKSKKILLGGRAMLALWLDCQYSMEGSALEWLRKNKDITEMLFLGLVMRAPRGGQYGRQVPCLKFSVSAWSYDVHALDFPWYPGENCALLRQASK